MAGSIALDSTAQASFTKAVQSLIKNDELQKEGLIGKSKKGAQKGVVYITHIPHGFYEEQMKGYFGQFGKVTNVKLARSKKTGKSKGFAFIEFEYAEVAQVVAETMNNYIMCNRLLKAEYIPHHRIGGKNFWKTNVTARSYPKLRNRRRDILAKNGEKTEEKVGMLLRKRRNHVDNIIEKLNARGISYSLREFDAPVGVQTAQPPTPVLEIDESDEEIEFQMRPNFTLKKKILKKSKKSSSKVLKASLNKNESIGSGSCKSPEPNKLHLMNVKKNLFRDDESLSPKIGRKSCKEECVDAILPLSSDGGSDSAKKATSGRKSKGSTEVLPTSSAGPGKKDNPAKSSKPKIKKMAEKFSARLQKKLKSRRIGQQKETGIESPAKFARKLTRKSASSKSAGDSGRKFSSKKLKLNGKLQGLAELGM